MGSVSGRVLGDFLHESAHVSRPLMLTVLIHTGPQVHSRDSHFVGGDRPARGRFRMAQTFWTGHHLLLSREIFRRVSLDEKDVGLVISLVLNDGLNPRQRAKVETYRRTDLRESGWPSMQPGQVER